jgi:hypothetical protein
LEVFLRSRNELGAAKVSELADVAGADEDVHRLDVAMDNLEVVKHYR